MKKVIELFNQLNQPNLSLEEKYPHFDTQDGKVHVLHLSTALNASGYYRAVAPMLALNETNTHSVIIAGLRKFDFNELPYQYDFPYDDSVALFRLTMWADYIVIPMTINDLSPMLSVLRKLNPEARFVMDIDRNLHLLPSDHPLSMKIGKRKERLISNMLLVDRLTASSANLLWYYGDLLGQQDMKMDCLPNLLSNVAYEGLEQSSEPKDTTRVRIGIVANLSAVMDVTNIWIALRNIQDQFGAKVEFILFGWNGCLPDGTIALQRLEYTYVKSVSFLDYHHKLNSLNLDIALLPMRDIDYHQVGKPFTKYLELAACQLPVVVSDIKPYNELIEDGVTGFLARDPDHWTDIMIELIQDHSLRKSIGYQAYAEVWNTHGYSPKSLQLFQEVYHDLER